jgi:DNA polymerase-3 subunit epsilon
MENKIICVLDVETNGFYPSNSVTQLCAIKYELSPDCSLTEKEVFNRYYFPSEKPNPEAVAVNGLSTEVLTEHRKGCDYPRNFSFDSDVYYFFENIKIISGHNIRNFDLRFLPFLKDRMCLDTMIMAKDVLKIPNLKSKTYKFPKLSECAEYFNISSEKAHDAFYDVKTTAKVLEYLLKDYQKNRKPKQPIQETKQETVQW